MCKVWAFIIFLMFLIPASLHPVEAAQSSKYGPEVKAFLSYVHQEEIELRFQLTHNEINQKDFTRSMNRLAVMRQAVLDYVKISGEDMVPEYHVVTTAEVEQLIPGGADALKGVKSGTIVAAKWRYMGAVVRGEQFFILERLGREE